jgi:hypothetical protein
MTMPPTSRRPRTLVALVAAAAALFASASLGEQLRGPDGPEIGHRSHLGPDLLDLCGGGVDDLR